MSFTKRAIIKIEVVSKGKTPFTLNYQRRMYAIIRKYTPEVSEGSHNVCYAELTGLRTFFKMSYQEMIQAITKDLEKEMRVHFFISSATVAAFESGKRSTKKAKSISTYKELGTFSTKTIKLATKNIAFNQKSLLSTRKVRLTVPFLGKVT